jgi:tRNA(adenine34) deaminase
LQRLQNQLDEHFMSIALSLAHGAGQIAEVPIGALIVRDRTIIASGINLRETTRDPTAHAEVVAIRRASRLLSSWRLEHCTLYVSLEPCVMCAGAIQLSRVSRVVYAAADPKGGAYESLYEVADDSRLNHRPTVTAGLMALQSRQLLKDFFTQRRK